MKQDKTRKEYLADPILHYKKLIEFRDMLDFRILGEEDPEWRGELEFILIRTKDKIREVQAKVL